MRRVHGTARWEMERAEGAYKRQVDAHVAGVSPGWRLNDDDSIINDGDILTMPGALEAHAHMIHDSNCGLEARVPTQFESCIYAVFMTQKTNLFKFASCCSLSYAASGLIRSPTDKLTQVRQARLTQARGATPPICLSLMASETVGGIQSAQHHLIDTCME